MYKTNQYGSYAQPAKASGGLYPSLPTAKDASLKVLIKGSANGAANRPARGSQKGKPESKEIMEQKGKPEKPSVSVVVAGDSNKGMLTSLIEKLKLSR